MGGIMFATGPFKLHQYTGFYTLWIGSTFFILSVAGLILRFWAKRRIGQGLFREDWMLLLAFVLSTSLFAGEIYAVKLGNLGRHIQVAPSGSIERSLRVLYFLQAIYTLSLAFTNFSITMIYRRLFKVHKTSYQFLVFDVISLLRLIAIILVGLLPCHPVDAFWKDNTPAKCPLNLFVVYITTAVWNIITNLILLYFPLPIIWNLQLYNRQKLYVYSFFLCAASVVLISILRLIAVLQWHNGQDLTWLLQPVAVWSTTEASFAIFCACIPSMRPLLQLLPRRRNRNAIHTAPSELQLHRTWWRGGNIHANSAHFMKMKGGIEEPFDLYGPRTVITARKGSSDDDHHGLGIRVRHEVNIDDVIQEDNENNEGSENDLALGQLPGRREGA